MMKRRTAAALLALVLGLTPALLHGQESSPAVEPPAAAVNSAPRGSSGARREQSPLEPADTLMVMGCAALAMLMTPALGLFYGGMVRRKNVLAAFQQSFILLGVVSIQWVLAGYSLAFGADLLGGLCGGWQWVGLRGVELEPIAELAPTIPHELFMIFQMMVAVFAVALISGAIAERMKFSSYLVFTLLWTTFVYAPIAHWVWAPDGWIKRLGALDFAGGLVVHLTSGLAALCCVRVLGKRKGLDTEDLHPHNLTLTALGTGLLWFGWLGLNSGQARARGRGGRRVVRHDQPRRRCRDRKLVRSGVSPETQGDGPGCVHRRDRRARGDHPGGGVRFAHGRAHPRRPGQSSLLRGDLDQGEARLRRLARRFRSARHRRPRRHPGAWLPRGAEPDRRGGRLARRQRQPVIRTVGGGCRSRRLHGCRHPGTPLAHRPAARAARDAPRRKTLAST